jgi:hypothetical protein
MIKHRWRALALAAMGIAFFAGAAAADPPPAPPVGTFVQGLLDKVQVKAKDMSLFKFDYGIPTSPALTLIGTSTAISSPSSALKPYVIALPASWGGASGNDAFSADVAAAWLLGGMGSIQTETYDQYYKGGWLHHLAYRTRLESALFLGADGGGDPSKAKASRLALGLSVSLLDDSDPLVATAPGSKDSIWKDCVETAFNSKEVDDYTQKYIADPSIAQLNAISATFQSVNNYASLQSVPGIDAGSLANAQTQAKNDLDTCFKGACKALDTTGRLAAAQSAGDYKAAAALLDVMGQQALANVNTMSAKLSASFGVGKKLDECAAAANAAARLGADVDIGGGAVWTGTPGKADGFKDMSGAIWISGRLPLGIFDTKALDPTQLSSATSATMLSGAFRAGFNETVATGNAATPSIQANVFSVWLGIEHYSATFRLAAQVGYNDTSATDTAFKAFDTSGTRWLVQASMRADKLYNGIIDLQNLLDNKDDPPENGVWVNVSYGSAQGSITALDDKLVMVSLSYSPYGAFNLAGEGL